MLTLAQYEPKIIKKYERTPQQRKSRGSKAMPSAQHAVLFTFGGITGNNIPEQHT